MIINLSKNIGFCNGVDRAITLVKECLKTNKIAYTTHPIIHNSIVMDNLKNKGLIITTIDKIPNNSTFIINAHGITKDDLVKAKAKDLLLIDCTCPFITKIREQLVEYNKKGYKIVFIGDKNHKEILSYSSYINDFEVIENADNFIVDYNKNYVFVPQSTIDVIIYNKIKENIQKLFKNNNNLVVFLKSICYTTTSRQNEAISMAKNNDIIIVVGDDKSANSKQLFNICREYCKEVYFIKSLDDLNRYKIKFKNSLGIISGASTPKELVMEVLSYMAEENKTIENSTQQSFAEIMNSIKEPKFIKPGSVCKVTVEKADQNGINVILDNVNKKNDMAFIPNTEVSSEKEYNPDDYKPGDSIECIFIGDNKYSIKKFEDKQAENKDIQFILDGNDYDLRIDMVFKNTVDGKVKLKGIGRRIGSYEVIIPTGQIKGHYINNEEELKKYIGKTLKVRVLPPKLDENGKEIKQKKKIYVSSNIIKDEEKQKSIDEYWSKVAVGNLVDGIVKRYNEKLGVFVKLTPYIDGLVRHEDIIWTKKNKLSIDEMKSVLEPNKTYTFIIIKADKENNKIGLSYKELQKKPYEIAAEKYPLNTVVKGKVTRVISTLGAFVEIEKNIEGLVHISELSRKYVENANDVIKVGDEVDCLIKSYDNEQISLSIKGLLPEEPEKTAEENSNSGSENLETKKKGKKEKKEKKVEEDIGPSEYISSNTGTTIGDLFGDILTDDSDND
ncbi:MAG: 4-hydroxy-3-methylbut-2-enyl diphosphate reductase [Clostridia bacterium]|nr:4-hydroxy-3-methylbut-2-enyl diphosphate reductase [Clostridia bacterium]